MTSTTYLGHHPGSTSSSLLRRIADAEDQHAWQSFVRRYRGFIRNLALRRGLSWDETNDIAQETFIKVAQGIHAF